MGKALSRAWSLPPRRNYVAVDRDLQVPMSDGTVLLADHYMPITGQQAATVLMRCPYGRGTAFGLSAQLIAERGYHVLLQSCRGTFGSGGQFAPMRNEAADGQDTVAWLRGQSWFDGRLATYGPSYLGFVQWALALDPPPELVAAIVQIGPHDFSRSTYRNGVFDLYNAFNWCDLVAHQEHVSPLLGALRTVTADRRLRPALDQVPVSVGARRLLGTAAAWFERWLEHPQLTDSFWAPVQCAAALERISVPTLLVGGWQDIFLEQTLEQYGALAARGVPVRLLVGPWTHVDAASKSGAPVAESLAWLDRYAGSSATDSGVSGTGSGVSGTGSGVSGTGSGSSGTGSGSSGTGSGSSGTGFGSSTANFGANGDHPVRIWVSESPEASKHPETIESSKASKIYSNLKGLRGLENLGGRRAVAGQWRELSGWPPAGTSAQRWYLGAGGSLGLHQPADDADVPPARFRYDPADPTPSVGGATLALNAGVRDNRTVEQRPDLLVFTSEPLTEPVEVVGYVTAELSVTRDNPYADLFVRLCDVDPRGRSRNVCDGIVRLAGADPLSGTVRVSLIAAAHRFGPGHRLRLHVAGGAHPRFLRNPGTGQVDAFPAELMPTNYAIGLGAADLSILILSAVGQAAAEPPGKAAAHA